MRYSPFLYDQLEKNMVDLAVSPRTDRGWHGRGRGDGAGGLHYGDKG